MRELFKSMKEDKKEDNEVKFEDAPTIKMESIMKKHKNENEVQASATEQWPREQTKEAAKVAVPDSPVKSDEDSDEERKREKGRILPPTRAEFYSGGTRTNLNEWQFLYTIRIPRVSPATATCKRQSAGIFRDDCKRWY